MSKVFNKKFILALCLVSGSASVYADSTIQDNKEVLQKISPAPMRIVSGIREAKEGIQAIFTYNEDSMYTIYSRVNHLTTIMLQPGETLLFVGGGDTARWRRATAKSGSQEGTREVIYIKPSSIDLKTNLVINTNKRSYQINLISHKSYYNPLVKWQYPEDEMIAKVNIEKIEKEKEEMQEKILDPTNLNYGYTINTDKYNFTPKEIFDDGIHTYILFNNNLQEMPVLYVKDGKELLIVNYRIKNNFMVVDRLFDNAELRLGNNVIKIKKKSK